MNASPTTTEGAAAPRFALDAAIEHLDRIKRQGGSRSWRLCIRKFNPGGLTAHQTVEVEGIHGGFDWEAGKAIITPAEPMTTLSPEDVQAIRKSVSVGGSWHAYKAQERLRDELATLRAALSRIVREDPNGCYAAIARDALEAI
jgi:hypothetical protein